MFAELLHFYFTQDSDRKIAAFTADAPYITSGQFCGLPVIPFDEIQREMPPEQYDMCASVGYAKGKKFIDALETRKRIYSDAQNKGYTLAGYISSKAMIAPRTTIGINSIIMEGCMLMPFVTVGNNVVIYSNTAIAHHGSVGDHTFIAGDVTLGSTLHVGEGSFLGVGTTIASFAHIGRENFIGTGTIITQTTEDGEVYTAGNRAKLRKMKNDKIYT